MPPKRWAISRHRIVEEALLVKIFRGGGGGSLLPNLHWIGSPRAMHSSSSSSSNFPMSISTPTNHPRKCREKNKTSAAGIPGFHRLIRTHLDDATWLKSFIHSPQILHFALWSNNWQMKLKLAWFQPTGFTLGKRALSWSRNHQISSIFLEMRFGTCPAPVWYLQAYSCLLNGGERRRFFVVNYYDNNAMSVGDASFLLLLNYRRLAAKIPSFFVVVVVNGEKINKEERERGERRESRGNSENRNKQTWLCRQDISKECNIVKKKKRKKWDFIQK